MRKWLIKGSVALIGVGLGTALVYQALPPHNSPHNRLTNAGVSFFHTQGRAAPAAYLMARHAEKAENVEVAAHYYNEAARGLRNAPNRAVLEDTMRTYLMAGDGAAAAAIAKDIVKITPTHQRANLLLALAALKRGNVAQAQIYLEAMTASPIAKFLRPHFDLWLSLEQNDNAAHTQARETLLQSKIFQLVNLAQTARAAEYAGDIKTAAQIYNLGVNAKGLNHLFFTLDYAQFLERQGNILKARKTYLHYQNKRFAHAYVKAGLARLKTQDPQASPPPLSTTPLHHLMKGLQALAEVMQAQGRQELALIYGNMAHYLITDNEEDTTSATLLQYQNAQRAAALSLWQLARRNFTNVKGGGRLAFRAQIRAAEIIDEMGDTETAIAALTELAEQGTAENLNSQVLIEMRQKAQIVLGDLYRHHERFNEAERAYSLAINAASDANPPSWNLYFARGIARERIGEWSQAETDLHKARRLSRNDPHVLNYLGYSWVDKGLYLHESLNILRQAVRAAPNNGFFLDSLGWAYYKLGNYNNALAFVERAAQIEPTDATITDHLGDILWRMGRHLEARYQWRKALAFNPSDTLRTQIEKKNIAGLGVKKRPSRIKRLPRGGMEI
ncbi:MAG: tetratricopeptide repeat protein [Alphaproteobacteria bacterium]|nr:tetratricopeptide repeat protein [Alphaproteobacteria bacterium]